jgi:4-diphosphocytidyl-2-C-methyl-D-erythritol kinase
MDGQLRLPSYAKINLALFIKGKRGDGYHEIATLLQQIDLKDEIEFCATDNPEIAFFCDHPDLSSGSSNLCVRAAYLLKEVTGFREGVEIKLTKVIPMGAGLGGGSSNAAVVLLGLNKLWKLNLLPRKLMELASRLGSDVPFFIHGGMAWAEGRGDILTWIDLGLDLPMLVVSPEVRVSTAWAYQHLNLDLTMKKKNIKLARFKNRNFNNVEFYKNFRNDFEAVIFKVHPILAEIKQRLLQQNTLFASMSGSGSSLFAVFRTVSEAIAAKALFENQYRTFLVRPLHWGYDQIRLL